MGNQNQKISESDLWRVFKESPLFMGATLFPEYFSKPFAPYHKDLIEECMEFVSTPYMAKTKRYPKGRPMGLLILISRGGGKTTIVFLLVAIMLLLLKKMMIGYVCNTTKNMKMRSKDIGVIGDNPMVVNKFGKVRKPAIDATWNVNEKEFFLGEKFPATVFFGSWDQPIRGAVKNGIRPQVMIFDDANGDPDDPETKSLSTDQMLDKLDNEFKPALDTYYHCMIFVATPRKDGDCVSERLRERTGQWKVIEFAAMNQEETQSMWEDNFPTWFLLQKKQEFIDAGDIDGWYCEYQLGRKRDKQGMGVRVFSERRYKFVDLLPHIKMSRKMFGGSSNFVTQNPSWFMDVPGFNTSELIYIPTKWTIAVDAAYTTNRGNCQTAMALGCKCDKTFYIIDEVSGYWGPEIFPVKVYELLMKWNSYFKLSAIYVESLMIDYIRHVLREYFIKVGYPVPTITYVSNHNREKKERIADLTATDIVFNAHLEDKFSKQLKVFPKILTKLDGGTLDSLDVISMLEKKCFDQRIPGSLDEMRTEKIQEHVSIISNIQGVTHSQAMKKINPYKNNMGGLLGWL